MDTVEVPDSIRNYSIDFYDRRSYLAHISTAEACPSTWLCYQFLMSWLPNKTCCTAKIIHDWRDRSLPVLFTSFKIIYIANVTTVGVY